MAYLREIENTCSYQGCTRKAVVQLFNNKNADMGLFCRTHGNQRLREMILEE